MSDRFFGQLATDVYGIAAQESRLAHIQLNETEAVAADEDGIHAGITGSATDTEVTTTDISNPPYPRNVVITPGGTTGDVKASSITVVGTNIADKVISEEFAFSANATTATTGTKAFKTITSISIPAQDGAGATFTVGFGDKLGLPFKLATKPCGLAFLDKVIESTAPTFTADEDEIEKNTIDLNSSLNGKVVDIYLFLD